ncbi:SNF2-related protein, partial [Lapillicoccus jejuensis]|uniref:SNF2-related protein n=1 Tax=Lapillicoccus jejuensis TaxID=402171 RepID=UPI0031D62458
MTASTHQGDSPTMSTFYGQLHSFQTEGVDFLVSRRRALLADDVGLGKTVQIAAAAARLWPELTGHPGLPLLYTTVAGLVAQTTKELRSRLPSLSIMEASTLRGAGHVPLPDVVVGSHDFLHRNLQIVLGWSPQLVVVDEASALKGGGAKYESVLGVCEQAPNRVIVATATPIEKGLLTVWLTSDLWRHRSPLEGC